MTSFKLQQIQNIIRQKPYLMWYTHNYDGLSTECVFESVIKYGEWQDFVDFTNILGIEQTSVLFDNIKTKKRADLTPQTTNFFTKYFEKYA